MRITRLEHYNENDLKQLKELHTTLKERPEKIENILPFNKANLEHALFIARNNGDKIIGFSTATIEKEGKYGSYQWICIHPDYREPPLGKELMKKTLNWMVNETNTKTVSVEGITKHGQGLLKYFGFEPHKELGWKFAKLNLEKFNKRVKK